MRDSSFLILIPAFSNRSLTPFPPPVSHPTRGPLFSHPSLSRTPINNMRFSSLLALMAPIALLSSASAAGLPANIPLTTLTERAITVPICVGSTCKAYFFFALTLLLMSAQANVQIGPINLVTTIGNILGSGVQATVQAAIDVVNALPLVPDIDPTLNLGEPEQNIFCVV